MTKSNESRPGTALGDDGHVTCMSSAMTGKLDPTSSVPNTTFRTWPESVSDSERVRTGCRAGLLVINQDRGCLT